MASEVITLGIAGRRAVRLEPYTIYRIGRKPELEFYIPDESIELAHAIISLIHPGTVRLAAVMGKIWLNEEEQTLIDLSAQVISDGHVKLRFGNVDAKLEIIEINRDGDEMEIVANAILDNSFVSDSETSSDCCFIPETESENSDLETSKRNWSSNSSRRLLHSNKRLVAANIKRNFDSTETHAFPMKTDQESYQNRRKQSPNQRMDNDNIETQLEEQKTNDSIFSMLVDEPCVFKDKTQNQKVSQMENGFVKQKLATKRIFRSTSPPLFPEKRCRFIKLPKEILQCRRKRDETSVEESLKFQEFAATSGKKV